MRSSEKRTLYLQVKGNISSTNDIIEAFLNSHVLESFKHLLESLYCLNWAEKLFVSSFRNEESSKSVTRDVVYYILKEGHCFKNLNDENFYIQALEPEPETKQISLFFVNPETTDTMIQDYIKENRWGEPYKIVRHTYSKYKNIGNGFVSLFMKSYNKNVVPEKCFINGRKIFVKTPETQAKGKCYACNKYGHLAKDCTKPKKCNICHQNDHEEKNCLKNDRDFLDKTTTTIPTSNVTQTLMEKEYDSTPYEPANEASEKPSYKSVLMKSAKQVLVSEKSDFSAEESDHSPHIPSLGDFISSDGKIPPKKPKRKKKPKGRKQKNIEKENSVKSKNKTKGKDEVFSKESTTDLISLFSDSNRTKKRGNSERSSRNSLENAKLAPSKKPNQTDPNMSCTDTETEENLFIISDGEKEDLT